MSDKFFRLSFDPSGIRGGLGFVFLGILCFSFCSTALAGTLFLCNGKQDGVLISDHAIPGRSCKRTDVSTSPASVKRHRGAVYQVRSSDGATFYTNRPSGKKYGKAFLHYTYIPECLACNRNSTIDWARVPLHLKSYTKVIQKAGDTHHVPTSLIRAVIHAESGWHPRAVSNKGASGLMQLMPATAKAMNVSDVFDPKNNIRGGVLYLSHLLHRFDGNTKKAVAAYNAGPEAVQRYHGVPPYTETQTYVKRVLLLYQRYREALKSQAADSSQPGKTALVTAVSNKIHDSSGLSSLESSSF